MLALSTNLQAHQHVKAIIFSTPLITILSLRNLLKAPHFGNPYLVTVVAAVFVFVVAVLLLLMVLIY